MSRNGSLNYFQGSIKKTTNSNDYYGNLNTSLVLAKTQVPFKHKQLASNYVLIKKLSGMKLEKGFEICETEKMMN